MVSAAVPARLRPPARVSRPDARPSEAAAGQDVALPAGGNRPGVPAAAEAAGGAAAPLSRRAVHPVVAVAVRASERAHGGVGRERGAPGHREYRYPLLDRRVLEFALGLPPEQYRRGRWSRWLMRHALRAVLPPEVCRHLSKDDPARHEPLRDASIRAMSAVGEDLAARASRAVAGVLRGRGASAGQPGCGPDAGRPAERSALQRLAVSRLVSGCGTRPAVRRGARLGQRVPITLRSAARWGNRVSTCGEGRISLLELGRLRLWIVVAYLVVFRGWHRFGYGESFSPMTWTVGLAHGFLGVSVSPVSGGGGEMSFVSHPHVLLEASERKAQGLCPNSLWQRRGS